MTPTVYVNIAYWAWIVLFLIWLVGYFGNKKTVQRTGYPVTSVLIALGFVLLFYPIDSTPFNFMITPGNLGLAGDVICIAGVLFGIWARLTLGTNWSGSAATVKENHQLSQRGPYQWVRHPLYTGFFIGMIGTALTLGTLQAYIGVVLGLVAFLMRIPVEEKLMEQTFPGQYQTYKQKVKAFIPFLW